MSISSCDVVCVQSTDVIVGCTPLPRYSVHQGPNVQCILALSSWPNNIFGNQRPRVRKVDVAINSSLRTIYGCLKPTPVFQLPVLAGIAPAGLRREAATLALARKAVKHDWHILHDTTKNEVPPCRLKSRKPYNKEAQEMLSVIPEDRSKDAWIAATWKQEWEASGPTRVHRYVSDPGEGRQWRRPEPKTNDDSKPTANWGWSVQSIHEEVGTGGQCGM